MGNARPPYRFRWRSLGLPALCLAPLLIILVIAAAATSTRLVPSYGKDDIEKRLGELKRKDAGPGSSAGPETPPATNDSKQAPATQGLSPERPKEEEDALAEQQRILQEKRQRLAKAGRDAGGDDQQLSLIEAEKKLAAEVKERGAEAKKKVDEEKDAADNRLLIRIADRVAWGTYTNIYLLICSVAILAAGFIIWKALGPAPWEWRLGLCAGAGLVSGAMAWFAAPYVSNYWMPPGIFSEGLRNYWPALPWLCGLFAALIFAVGLLIALACAALTWELPRVAEGPAGAKEKAGEKAELKRGVGILRQRAGMLRLLLYMAGAVLVAKVLQSHAFVEWALTYFDLGGTGGAFDNFRRSVIGQESVGYTIFLTALYLPAFLVIRARATQCVQAAGAEMPEKDQAEFLKENGLTFSVWEQLPRILTILAPLLAGTASALLEKLGK